MAFNTGGDTGAPMSQINVTPLVDVMLVLLIIFMITAPLMTQKTKVQLPKATLEKREEAALKVLPITLAIREDGSVYWNDEPVTKALLESRLSVEAQKTPQPSINVRGDRTTKYRIVSDVVNIAQSQGMRRVGFIAEPERTR